jgi:hypothetical protein
MADCHRKCRQFLSRDRFRSFPNKNDLVFIRKHPSVGCFLAGTLHFQWLIAIENAGNSFDPE